ncbi:sodium:solute symporter [Pseudoxanthomonas broegbernensis]|uniref:Sodium:solute symporter n=1 Tax=Pseudoxanthomonas broegbernensis TaxID=83619 RepID=A0A7V8GLI8_9GAMM|nr:sodium:solute symporter [Pseudoxanthomonas broegbernensis]KAF1685846.1 sodium:solute symporter [Pseudoxanthomonas broegbernensis]MBB6064060.1 SSS family transporter [Pseudoxanthomonas broegbernensis]
MTKSMSRSSAGWLLLLLAALMAPPVQAEDLVSVESTRLPDWDARRPVDAGLAIGGQPVVVSGTSAWELKDGQWQDAGWRVPDGLRIASVATGEVPYLVLEDGAGRALQLAKMVRTQRGLSHEPLPALPQPLSQVRAAGFGNTVTVAGLDAEGAPGLWQYDGRAWRRLGAWSPAAAPQRLMVQGGGTWLAVAGEGGDHLLHRDADGAWTDRGALPEGTDAATGRTLGQAHLLFLVRGAGGTAALARYHVITDSWASLDAPVPASARVVAPAAGGMYWLDPASGQFAQVGLGSGQHLLRTTDWVVIVLYLAAMLGMGAYFYFQGQNASTSDFFVGGRSIPFWAAGISLYATNTSSISYIAIPAKAFETNWQYLTNNLMAVLGLVFVAIWIVPLLRRLDLMSVFTYLETRFHPAIRMLASLLCIVMQIGSRLSVILFLPSLAIATITGLDVVWSILLMGVFTIVYTTIGGMRAVVWTDVVQVIVMFGGAAFAIGYMLMHMDGGASGFVAEALAQDKTKIFDFSFDLTKATVWGFIFLVLFDVVLTFPKDQVLMQRVLATRNSRDAGRSVWMFAAIMIPGGFVFYGIGAALWGYYRSHPERLDPSLPIDATFPLFIAAELPAGVTGLIIAGIFAAAMSTMSSIINSVSTLISVDFYERIAARPSQETSVRIAEWSGVLVGAAGIAIALVMSRYDIHSLFDVSIELAGLLGGGFAGAYTLGMFTRRANAKGVAIGVVGSIVITLGCWLMDLVHPYFYLAISIMLCIVIGYLASLLFPAPQTQALDGLTIHHPRQG